MQTTPRIEVYAAIDGERDYQDTKFPTQPTAPLTPTESVRVMYELLRNGNTDWYNSSDTIVDGLRINSSDLHMMRKVAAVAVRCMESWGAPKRTIPNR